MVVQEEPGSDVEGDEHVDGVVFMCGQDEEDAEKIEDPGQRVNEVPAPWGVCIKETESSFIYYLDFEYTNQKCSIFK